ncbi:MAG: phytanoyl-CoA dioxygenase family protein [Chloroflexota bacterium]
MTNQHAITDAEMQSYQEHGYFVRTGAYTVDEMDQLGNHVNWLIAQMEESPYITHEQRRRLLARNGQAAVQTGPASLVNIFRISLFSRFVRQHMKDEQRLAIAHTLVGEDLFCPNDLYFLKPPGTGKAVAWHQDSWYFRNTYQSTVGYPIEETTVGTWLAIDDADVENGCLWVIPGTHRHGVVDHGEDDNADDKFLGKNIPRITDELDKQAVPVEVPKGSLVVFNNALLHRSTPNRSDRYRRAYIVHYMKATNQYTERGYHRLTGQIAEWGWGTPETYICGQRFPDCVQATLDSERLNWDERIV